MDTEIDTNDVTPDIDLFVEEALELFHFIPLDSGECDKESETPLMKHATGVARIDEKVARRFGMNEDEANKTLSEAYNFVRNVA